MKIDSEVSIDSHVVRLVAKEYNPLDYSIKLCELLSRIYPLADFNEFPKTELHRLINDTLLEFYNGEQQLKYYLFCHFNLKNVVCGFEIKVNRSRLDFLAVNGKTTSFEIKSGLDNLDKLEKQTSDFVRVFEYNYVVIDEVHLEKVLRILPASYGIWSFKAGIRKIYRTAVLNEKLDSELQLCLLSKSELRTCFGGNTDIQEILNKHKPNVINAKFKEILKFRYKKRWRFIVDNKDEILPIDIQFFYNRNIEPSHIYS